MATVVMKDERVQILTNLMNHTRQPEYIQYMSAMPVGGSLAERTLLYAKRSVASGTAPAHQGFASLRQSSEFIISVVILQ